MSVPQEVVNYIFQAFPNASILLQEIIRKHAQELISTFAFGLVSLWKFIYDRLLERSPESIEIKAACETVAEAPGFSNFPVRGHPLNGYSTADKNVLDKILENTEKEGKKNQLYQYRKQGTLQDAMADFEKFSGEKQNKGSNVWTKELLYGKKITIREKSNYSAKATSEIQKPNTKGVLIPIIKIRYV